MGSDFSDDLDEQVESAAAAAERAHKAVETAKSQVAHSRVASETRASDNRELEASKKIAEAADEGLSEALDREEEYLRHQDKLRPHGKDDAL